MLKAFRSKSSDQDTASESKRSPSRRNSAADTEGGTEQPVRNAREPRIRAEALADLESPRDVHLSSSGACVVYSLQGHSRAGKNLTASLWIAQVGIEDSSRQVTFGNHFDHSPQFSANSKSIAFLSDRGHPGEGSSLYVLPFSRVGEARPLTNLKTDGALSAFSWSPDGDFIAFLSLDHDMEDAAKENDAKVYGEGWNYSRLRIVNTDTYKVTTLSAQTTHVYDFTWNDDSTHIAYASTATPEFSSSYVHGTTLEIFSLRSKSSRVFCKYPTHLYDFAWLGNNLFWRSSYDQRTFVSSNCVYGMSMTDKTWDRKIGGETDCIYQMKKCHGRLVMLRQAGLEDSLITTTEDTLVSGEEEIKSFDVAQKEGQNAVVLVRSAGMKPDEVFSSFDGKLTCLSNHGKLIAGTNKTTMDAYAATSRDGTPLDGILLTPHGLDTSKPAPTIVLVHGGPYSRVTCSFDPIMFNWAQYLASAGYQILCPNYRGNSSHGDKYTVALQGKIGVQDYEDIIDMVREGVDEGSIDKDRVAIGGWSQGGFLSYLAVTRSETFHFKAAVCGAGITDWDLLQMTSDTFTISTELSGQTPWSMKAENVNGRRGSPIWHMDSIKTPILILHGEDDKRVPVSQAYAFHRGCMQRGVDCQLVTYPREGHGSPVPFERAHYVDVLERTDRKSVV